MTNRNNYHCEDCKFISCVGYQTYVCHKNCNNEMSDEEWRDNAVSRSPLEDPCSDFQKH